MISVGIARNAAGQPVMLEKAYPTSEILYGQWGPSMAEEFRRAGIVAFFDGMPGAEHQPQRVYSHSSVDVDPPSERLG